jgi:signal peptide peptidase SppA
VKQPAHRVLSAFRQPWLVAPDVLQDLRDIALRARAPDFEAAAKIAAARADRMQATELLSTRRGIAVLPIHGPIFPRANLFTEMSGATSIDMLTSAFRQARFSKDVNAIVLDIDSPGGSVTGISEFSQMVRASKKPVFAYVTGMAASAAYWIASATSQIVANDTSWLGSIGVVSMFTIDDDESVIEIVSSQSPHKRYDVRTDEGRSIAQRHVDDLASVFIDTVAANRGVTSEKVMTDFGRGDVLLGHAAVRAGMADGVGVLDDLISNIAAKAPRNTKALPSFQNLILEHGYDGAARIVAAHDERQRSQLTR